MKRMTIRKKSLSGSKDPRINQQEINHKILARKTAEEGIVLMKNEGILPLDIRKPVGLFGAGAGNTIKGGTGSGDVCERNIISVYQGMKEAGFIISSEDWVQDCMDRYVQARENWKKMIFDECGGNKSPTFFEVYSIHTFEVPYGREIEETDLRDADTAIYVISRTAGEDADRKAEVGDYYLTENEIAELKRLASLDRKIIVLLNVGGIIDLEEIHNIPQVKAILSISQPGMEGGHAVANILSGAVNPSGKLTDTWAKHYDDYPNSATFSHRNGDVSTERYEESIYVGYRYFDSFGIEAAYGFGHGLSYTDFDISMEDCTCKDDQVSLSFLVKNIGKVAGKEVVQVYLSCPQKTQSKEFRRLVGYAKTQEIKPGEDQKISISIEAKSMASFDESMRAWVIDSGDYYIFAGSSLESSQICAGIFVEEDVIYEKNKEILPLKEELPELYCPDDIYKEMLSNAISVAGQIPKYTMVPKAAICQKEQKSPYLDIARQTADLMSEDELIYMCIGKLAPEYNGALGAAGISVPGAAGETCGMFEEKYNIASVVMADGPAGIRVLQQYRADENTGKVYTQGPVAAIEKGYFADPLVDIEGTGLYYQYCTAFPVGTMVAQTWNDDLIYQFGQTVGEEMEELGISWWLAPGMNIHRNPLCGRNFEYYSEDPYLSGMMAASLTNGVQSRPGLGTTIKHFICNNQEDNRYGSNSIVSERTLREIYLRGFEIAIRKSQPMAVMSSYNLVNGLHTATSPDILLEVLRNEWGFEGLVMSDWTTTDRGTIAYQCPKSGNDLIMPGTINDFNNIKNALKSGDLTKEHLKDCVTRLLAVILQTSAYEEAKPYFPKK